MSRKREKCDSDLMTPCRFISSCRRFEAAFCLHLHGTSIARQCVISQNRWKNLESCEYDSAVSYETLGLICATYFRLLVCAGTNDS
jgi:hypothetical protein